MSFMISAARLGALSLVLLTACASSSDDASSTNNALTNSSTNADLGEQLEANEPALIQQIADAAASQVAQNLSASSDRVARRDSHSKAHGCVTGSFQMNDSVPLGLAQGTFQKGAHYDAWIRFSNGSQADDRSNDARGMAIKLLNVGGEQLLTGDGPKGNTHDFILSNHHTFFLANISEYVDFMKVVSDKGNPLSFFFSANPLNWHPVEAWLARNFTTQPISNPLTSRYWSVTPYALGKQAVKYSVRPCGGADTSGQHADDKDFLAAALKDSLANGGACFDFMVQPRPDGFAYAGDPKSMPVEDATVTWSETVSPFVPIAKLTIPAQEFDSPAQQAFCENLSFTPWHATAMHQPLGRINRTRRVVYEATAKARHDLNGVQRVEPTDLTVH
jgi:catalase